MSNTDRMLEEPPPCGIIRDAKTRANSAADAAADGAAAVLSLISFLNEFMSSKKGTE